MRSLRILSRRYSHVALALLCVAFLIRAAIPTGFMVAPLAQASGASAKTLTVAICHGASSDLRTIELAIPVKAPAPERGKPVQGKPADCAFSALSLSAIGGTPPALLAVALAAILLLGLAPLTSATARAFSHLRPPLRGPPATI